ADVANEILDAAALLEPLLDQPHHGPRAVDQLLRRLLIDVQQRVAQLDVALVADDELQRALHALAAIEERVDLIRRLETRPGDRPAPDPRVIVDTLDPRRRFERLANAVDLRQTSERRAAVHAIEEVARRRGHGEDDRGDALHSSPLGRSWTIGIVRFTFAASHR